MPVQADGVGVEADQAIVGADIRAGSAPVGVEAPQEDLPGGGVFRGSVPGVDPFVEFVHAGVLVVAHQPDAHAVHGDGDQHAVHGQAVAPGDDDDVHDAGAQRVEVGAVALGQADVDVLAVVGGEAFQQVVVVADDESPGGVRKRSELQHAADVLRLHARLGTMDKAGGEGASGNQDRRHDQADGFFADHRSEVLVFEVPEAEDALRLRGWV